MFFKVADFVAICDYAVTSNNNDFCLFYYFSRHCKITKGDVVCDPMCGGGSIPIEVRLHHKTHTQNKSQP